MRDLEHFIDMNRGFLTFCGIVIVIVVLIALAPTIDQLIRPSTGVGIILDHGSYIDKPTVDHLADLIPPVWRKSALASWVLYEVHIKPENVVLEQCQGPNRLKMTRMRLDLKVSIVEVKTGNALGDQTFDGKLPASCDDQITSFSLAEWDGMPLSYDGGIVNPPEIEQWMRGILAGEAGLPDLKDEDMARTGIKIPQTGDSLNDYSALLDQFSALIPASWKTPDGSRSRYEFLIEVAPAVVETCDYGVPFDNSDPFFHISRVQLNVSVEIFDLSSFEMVDEKTFEGGVPPACPATKGKKLSELTTSEQIEGSLPRTSGFESWLKTITPDLVGLGDI